MTTDAQSDIDRKMELFEQFMDDDEFDWSFREDTIPDELGDDDDEPVPTEEEQTELWQNLIDMALLTRNKKYTFVGLTPAKSNSKCNQPRTFIR